MITSVKRAFVFVLALVASVCVAVSCSDEQLNSEMKQKADELAGPYLGQNPPGDMAELFAPGIVSDGLNNRDMAITPDGDTIFFTNHFNFFLNSAIMYTNIVDGAWTKPEVTCFSADSRYFYAEPHVTPDGKHLLYLTNQPVEEGAEPNENIWAVDRTGEGWGEPYPLPAPINTEAKEYFATATYDGTIYFTRSTPGSKSTIYRSRLVDGVYQEPELLPEQVNCGEDRFNVFVAADESYAIVPAAGMEDSRGATDYYITFRSEDDTWSEPVNMGDVVNTASGREYSAYVTRDGKYMFFMSMKIKEQSERPAKLTAENMSELWNGPEMGTTDIYWVKADFIEKLRPAK